MGKDLIAFYRLKIKNSWKIAFYSTLIIGILTHLYKFTNTLLNHDSVYNFYSTQNVVGSGRWFLSIACGISSYFDLPWINGFLSIIYIALTVVIIVELFNLKNFFLIILCGGLLVTSPSITETLFFGFTADGYMLAMLLGALAVYLSRLGENNKYFYILSSFCICLLCGIYQAYVSFALILAILHFMYELLDKRYEKKDYYDWIKRQIVIFTSALIIYYIVWKIILLVFEIPTTSYQGIDKIGMIGFSGMITGLYKSIVNFFIFLFQWNVFEHGFTLYAVLNFVFILFGIFTLCIVLKKSQIHRNATNFILFILCILAFIPFSYIWNFISESLNYRPMMLTSLVLLYMFVGILSEKYCNSKFSNLMGILLISIILNNGLMANISYHYMELCNQKTFADSIEMMSRIHYFENEQQINDIYIIGDKSEEVGIYKFNDYINDKSVKGQIQILSNGLEQTLFYDSERTYFYLKKIHHLNYEYVTEKRANELNDNEKIKTMENWPSVNSMKVIDETLVIKLSDIKEK